MKRAKLINLKNKLYKELNWMHAFQRMTIIQNEYAENKIQSIIYLDKSKIDQILQMLNHMCISNGNSSFFVEFINENIAVYNTFRVIGNMPPDYSIVLNNSLEYLFLRNKDGNSIQKQNAKLIKGVIDYINSVIDHNWMKDSVKKNLQAMISSSAVNLEDALQRIIFWSGLFWQSGHRLVGLGRLDLILDRFANDQSDEDIIALLSDFMKIMHEHYGFKSAELKGDTGQLIILGGSKPEGGYFCNRLTYFFIEALEHIHIPDPKILLRIDENTPDDLIQMAVRCISTGIGSPLLSNDKIVIPALIDFGYDYNDAYNYVVSACWEPLSYGNSLEQNNLVSIDFAKVFIETMKDKGIVSTNSFDEFLKIYKKHLSLHINDLLEIVDELRWEEDPLYTFFTNGCIENDSDISKGGSKYVNYGILSIGLSNAVNSILSINKCVYEEKTINISKLHTIYVENDEDSIHKEYNLHCSNEKFFGHDRKDVLLVIHSILSFVEEVVKPYRNRYGGKIKFGLSSPSYLKGGKHDTFTFDGRESKTPLGVHISADDEVPFTELVQFAAKIGYRGISSNGNVIDFVVDKKLIEEHFNSFCNLIQKSVLIGIFQMQMNVVSSEDLRNAKKYPDLYKNLIVRVWGFSSYYIDLPSDYQDLLISRAEKSEGIAN